MLGSEVRGREGNWPIVTGQHVTDVPATFEHKSPVPNSLSWTYPGFVER